MTAKGTPPAGTVRLDQIGDRYMVEREIGRGGMATVYLCSDSRDGGKVAVKVLRPELGSAVVVERFLREIAFASELDHPQIPKVLDSGVVGDLPYYVMNFIEGESLRARLDRERQLPIEEAIRITQEVVKPTAYAHARGIVHRDLKPGNILLSKDTVYVLDFGVARAIMASADESLTSTGVAVGTPAYMSPEQALADQHVDTRSDIYSLGCVVYEMVAGIPPFVGATAQAVMSRRFIAPPPPLHEARESVPVAVEAAVMRALARSPADRWQNVEKLGEALAGGMQSPSSHAEQAVLNRKRRLYARALVAVVVVALSGGAAAVWRSSSRDYLSSGRRAFERWDFAGAEVEFAKAVSRNKDDPAANLWMGQALALRGAPRPLWTPYILRAGDGRLRLSASERLRADALAASLDEASATRCDQLRRLSLRPEMNSPGDHSAAIYLADCLRADRHVIPDPKSPSRFSFASSFHEAAQLYEGIIARNSGNGAVYRTLMPRLEQVLSTNRTRLRGGTLAGSVERNFAATPDLIADTLAYVPFPVVGTSGPSRAEPERIDRVISRNREKLKALATDWTRADPNNPDAQETLARILEAGGQLDGPTASALASLTLARAAALGSTTRDDAALRRIRLASAQVRVLLKLGRFAEAAAVADSALAVNASVREDSVQVEIDALRTGLLALTGRFQEAIAIDLKGAADLEVRLPSGELRKLTAELAEDVQRLRDYAAFGTPRDSILAVHERLSRNLEAFVPAAELAALRDAILVQPMSLAVDAAGTGPLAGLRTQSGGFPAAVAAIHRGDRRTAQRIADSIAVVRSASAPGEITMDAVFQEAWLWNALGNPARAATSLDRALRGLSRSSPSLLRGATLAPVFVRVMIMRSNLARSGGDSVTARRWSEAASALWNRGDPAAREKLPQLRSGPQ